MGNNEIWSSVCKGEAKGFDTLFGNYSDMLYAYGMKIANDDNMVKEAIQDLFINIYNQREKLTTPQSIEVYLLRALKNTLFMKFNNNSRWTKYHVNEEIESLSDYYDFKLELDAESMLINSECDNEKITLLHNAIEELPGRQKEAIYLKYYNDLSGEEIAEIMGISHQTVRSTLMYGLSKLREKLCAPRNERVMPEIGRSVAVAS